MEKKVCEICGSEKNMGKTEDINVAILIAESVVTLVEAMGMISDNQERLSNGLSIGYSVDPFYCIADELRGKIETLKKQSNT